MCSNESVAALCEALPFLPQAVLTSGVTYNMAGQVGRLIKHAFINAETTTQIVHRPIWLNLVTRKQLLSVIDCLNLPMVSGGGDGGGGSFCLHVVLDSRHSQSETGADGPGVDLVETGHCVRLFPGLAF